jgi:hypothetical protein
MYIELVLSDYDGFSLGQGVQDSTPETTAGLIATHKRALDTFTDIIKCLTCVNFDGGSSSLNLSSNARDTSIFLHDDPKNPTLTSFLKHTTTFGPALVDGAYDYANWTSCQNTTTRICDTILQFDTLDTVYNEDGTVNTTNSVMAYLYVKMEYIVAGAYDLPMIITLSLISDGTTKPTTINPELSQTITYTKSAISSGMTVTYAGATSYKLILSLSKNHLYVTGTSGVKDIIGGVTTNIHTAALLTKYTPMDVWYNTPVTDNKNLFNGWKKWAFMRVFTQTPSSGPSYGCALNIFSNKAKTLVSDAASCKLKWSSTMSIMHSSASDQGKLPIYLISDESKQQAMYMQHLNITSASGLGLTGDISSNNNIYWMHGLSGSHEDIISDVFGRSYKLLLLNTSNKAVLTLVSTANGPADTKKLIYPKLAIPMF